MKNYLFAPFNDEGEQIEGFNAIRDYLPNKYRNALIMFLARLESTYDVIISKLESDNSTFHGQYDKIQELQAENKRLNRVNAELSDKLQAVNDDYNNDHKVHNEYEDGLLAEIKELKAEIKAYINAREGRINTINDLNKINDRLMKQVSSNRGNNGSVHTISGEIQEYMDNNPKSKGARLFLIPHDEFKNDEYDNTIYWDDGIE